MIPRALLSLSLLLPASLAVAAPSPQLQAVRQEIAALQLDRALNLSQQQARSLLPVLQGARAARADHDAKLAAAEPALLSALQQAVADLQTSGSISPATQQAIEAARPEAPGAVRQTIQGYRQQIEQILTPQQLQALRTTPLGAAAAGPAGRDGRGHRGPFHRLALVRTFLSDRFLALVQARGA